MPSFNQPRTPLASHTDTFLTPLPASDSKQVQGIFPRPMTEMSSQDGVEQHQEVTSTPIRSLPASKIDRSGLDPIRPPSAVSSQTYQSARSPPSRGGGPFSGGWRAGGAFGGPGGTRSNASRPPSAISRTSRTHVPSLASHAFFRPMSSQRLQAQRRARPSHVNPPAPNFDGFNETAINADRQSMGSNATGQPELSIYHNIDLPTPSRGTEFSEPDERDTVNASPTGNATVQSIGESERPLQTGSSNWRPKYQSPDESKQNNISPSVQKSSMTFSANFLVSTKRDLFGLREARGVRHVSSPHTPAGGSRSRKPSQPGINYQYFSGNTIFCWRGRLQNARDQPANIITGILVVLPAALFFVYSYVAF